MGKPLRDAAIMTCVEGGLVLAAWLIPKVRAKPPAKPPVGEAILQGKVIEAEYLLPIPYATIKFNGLECSADENGEYQIVEIPPGDYTLIVTANGYHPKTLSITIEEAKVYTRDVLLEPISLLLSV